MKQTAGPIDKKIEAEAVAQVNALNSELERLLELNFCHVLCALVTMSIGNDEPTSHGYPRAW